MPRLSFCNSKTKGHCSENHSFSKPMNMNDRLRTMKVVIENVCKFICVMKTKFLCLGNFHFLAKPTSSFHSICREYICCSRISEEGLIAPYFCTVNWNFGQTKGFVARYVIFFICWLWKFDPRSSTRLMPNFSVSFSHRRETTILLETNHSSL